MITVGLYSNTENELIADKNPSAIASYAGDVRGEIDWLNPTVMIEAATPYEVESANYMSIDAGNTRYYFITSKRAVTGSLWEITGRADLRHTYRSDILSSTGIVCRQESNYDMYLEDNKIPTDARKTMVLRSWGNTLFTSKATGSGNQKACVMLVLGGD